jgi:hypothetical protein
MARRFRRVVVLWFVAVVCKVTGTTKLEAFQHARESTGPNMHAVMCLMLAHRPHGVAG